MSRRKHNKISTARKAIRLALVERDMSIKELARLIKRPRPTVSKAINTGAFPRVQQQIAEVLHA